MSLVLVADDEPAVLEVLSDVVEDLGHEVLRAHDGREALNAARAHLPNLVVTDHMMPRLTGVDLCRQLRQDSVLKHVPVILLSAALPQGIPEAEAFLPKPFELSEFERLVEATLAKGRANGADGGGLPAHAVDADHLINSVAHEIRTPLAAARLNLQLLERSLHSANGAADQGYLKSLGRQLSTLDAMVSSLLDASRIADGKLELERQRLDLCALVETWLARKRPGHGEIEFVFVADQPKIELVADQTRVQQILDSVLASIVRYGYSRRKVAVEAHVAPDAATLKICDSPAADGGFPATTEARPIEDAGGGHAVELYVAAQLARLHGGALTVRSATADNAVYTLRLPR